MSVQIQNSQSGKHRSIFDSENPRAFRDEYKCEECGEWMDQDEVVWVNPATGEATTGDEGQPFHDCCAPEEYEYE